MKDSYRSINKYKERSYIEIQFCDPLKKELLNKKCERLEVIYKPSPCYVEMIVDSVDTLGETTFKVVVFENCDLNDYDFVKSKLDVLYSKIDKPVEIISGYIKGGDNLGERYSLEQLSRRPTTFTVSWNSVGGTPDSEFLLSAELERNEAMLNYADEVVVFRNNNSTDVIDMVEKFKTKWLQVRVYDVE